MIVPGFTLPVKVYRVTATGERVLVEPTSLSFVFEDTEGSFSAGDNSLTVFKDGNLQGRVIISLGEISTSVEVAIASTPYSEEVKELVAMLAEANQEWQKASTELRQAREWWAAEAEVRQTAFFSCNLYYQYSWPEVKQGIKDAQPARVYCRQDGWEWQWKDLAGYPADLPFNLVVDFSQGPSKRQASGEMVHSVQFTAHLVPKDGVYLEMPLWNAALGDGRVIIGTLESPPKGPAWDVTEVIGFNIEEVMQRLYDIRVDVVARRFATLEEAEQATQERLRRLLEAEMQNARRKQEALEKLRQIDARSPDIDLEYILNEWSQALDDFTSMGVDRFIEERTGLEGLSSGLGKAKKAVDLASKTYPLVSAALSGADALGPAEQVRAINQAFTLGRSLGPGGPMLRAVAPFLDFYQQALDAIATALGQIQRDLGNLYVNSLEPEELRSVVSDPVWRQKLEQAIEMKKLLDRIRDP
ncbi:MAG TPA: hypothetical protein G4O01_05120 [Dehalococcoidia bacterium]|nr:hypothetical protein [Dehalococcoidia bacterium]